MTREILAVAVTLSLAGGLALGVPAARAADAGETETLAKQTAQMDSLATTRGAATVSSKISSDFSSFAGSTANADALVAGLRSGNAITLTSTDPKGVTTSTTFTPPTAQMGYGNVYTSLALARQQLAGLGITDPTAQQIQAALVGGTVTGANGQTTTLTGVLTLRAQGMGWGQIAQSFGYKLGPVISGMKSANANLASQPAARSTAAVGAAAGASGSAAAGAGQGNAYGRGIVTGGGTAGGAGQGNAYGRGIVTGTGAPAGQAGQAAAAQGKSAGKGN